MGIVGCELAAFSGEAVDVRRAIAHQALVVSADVPVSDIVSHDEEDVRFVLSEGASGPQQDQSDDNKSVDVDHVRFREYLEVGQSPGSSRQNRRVSLPKTIHIDIRAELGFG